MSSAAGRLDAAAARPSFRDPLAQTASLVALPLLVLLAYTNASDLAMRSTGLPSMMQPLIALLGAAIVLCYRELRAWEVLQPLTFALAAWCGAVALSTLWARDLAAADARAAETIKGFALYLVVTATVSSWRSLKSAIAALGISATALAALTIVQAALREPVTLFAGLARSQSSPVFGEVVEARASGPLGDPNFFAQILIMVIPLALFAAVAERRVSRRIAWLVAACLILTGTLLTYSRGAMIALLVMAALALAAVRLRRKDAGAALAVAAIVVTGLLLIPIDAVQRFKTVESLLSGPAVEHDSSISKRKLLLSSSLLIFEDHPLLGVGAGNFSRHFATVRNEVGYSGTLYETRGSTHYPHNFYLEVAAENGLLGLAALGTAVAIAFLALRRARMRLEHRGDRGHAALVAGISLALTGYLVSSLFLHGAFQRYLWLLLALVAAAFRLAAREGQLTRSGEPA